MDQIIVAYWTGTGNTQVMAEMIGKGIEGAGKKADCTNKTTESACQTPSVVLKSGYRETRSVTSCVGSFIKCRVKCIEVFAV